MSILKTQNLTKYYRTPFALKKIPALTDLNLEIEKGEIFGYVGPNGAGKTTTFKLLMGLIRPSRGTVSFWGQHHMDISLRARMGYLPESPYFYEYLRTGEYLTFASDLFGLGRRHCAQRVDSLLELVGITPQKNKLIKHCSKGMLQRLGLAQALINDPDLLILDEPMSGLDPLGRKEVRDIILYLKSQGKTIIFSTHILSDVETVCDRVGIILNGTMKHCGPLDQLLAPKIQLFEICARHVPQNTVQQFHKKGFSIIERGSELFIKAREVDAYEIISILLNNNGTLLSFTPIKETLEDIYLTEIRSLGEFKNP